MHRDLGHFSVQKQMHVIETAKIDDLNEKIRTKRENLVVTCSSYQLSKEDSRWVLF